MLETPGISTRQRILFPELIIAIATISQDSNPFLSIPVKDRTTFKAFVVTLVIKITQQFNGYLIVLIYAGFVFQRAAESSSLQMSPNKQIMMIGALQLLGSVVATCVVERTGRKVGGNVIILDT